MPTAIVAYVAGLLYSQGRRTCTAFARSLKQQVSHDSLTRALQRVERKSQALLIRLARTVFGAPEGGYLIVDDTVLEKAFARCIEGLAWVWSSKANRSVWGLSIVALCWSNGTITIPLAFRIWHKGGTSKLALAADLLRYAHSTLKLRPQYVLFDSYYSGKAVLKTVIAYGWKFVSQVKRNRLLNGVPVKRRHRHPYWIERGVLTGDIEVLIVRHGKKYFVTNDVSLSKHDILSLYRRRWSIEEVFRFLHNQLGVDHCQARTMLAQSNHIRFCCMAYLLLTRASQRRNLTLYALKEKLALEREVWAIQVLKPIFQGA